MPITMQLLAQLFTSLLSAFFGAWFGAKFGARSALEQAKKERAIERRLEWQTNAVRMLTKFKNSAAEYRTSLLLSSSFDETELTKIATEVEQRASELLDSLSEATLFTDKQTIGHLKSARSELANIISEAKEVITEPFSDFGRQFDFSQSLKRLGNVAEEVHGELGKWIREQLGLEELAAHDLAPNPSPAPQRQND